MACMLFSVIMSDSNQYTYAEYVERSQGKEERKKMSKEL